MGKRFFALSLEYVPKKVARLFRSGHAPTL
jgi:hypothetical protein